ncbi:hypothetical protein FV222_16595 [Methylobacterium sp. WL103]|nr:hypothetical protein FV226_19375 [Methylobacterium sp. WL12]TXM97150.1 hypothetical protein FV222_16595 [Methylobacterium sp. WL103]TXM99774.1 hypothetical protein FV219_13395 [Methylobacterium sp. WL122]TXN78180.1 hypothetical protein FV234_23040 [Methylobacterium sp. WL8]
MRTEEPLPFAPPQRRLPPRFADDEVGKALAPRAGRGDAREADRQTRGCVKRVALSEGRDPSGSGTPLIPTFSPGRRSRNAHRMPCPASPCRNIEFKWDGAASVIGASNLPRTRPDRTFANQNSVFVPLIRNADNNQK